MFLLFVIFKFSPVFLNNLLPQTFFYLHFFGYFSFISSDSSLSVHLCEWGVRFIFMSKWFVFPWLFLLCCLFLHQSLGACVLGWFLLTSRFYVRWTLREPVFRHGVLQNARWGWVLFCDANIFSLQSPILFWKFLWFLHRDLFLFYFVLLYKR